MDMLEESGIPRLEVPASEDPMQLSPDIDRHLALDEDIDIDLDLEAEPLGEYEDDATVGQIGSTTEDQGYSNHQERVVNDDDMVDEDNVQGIADDHTSLIDEDLDDVEDQHLGKVIDAGPEDLQHLGLQGDFPSEVTEQQHQANIQDLNASGQNRLLDGDAVNGTETLPEELHARHVKHNSNYIPQDEDRQARLGAPSVVLDNPATDQQDDLKQGYAVDPEDKLDELDEDVLSHDNIPATALEKQSAVATDVAGFSDTKDAWSLDPEEENGRTLDSNVNNDRQEHPSGLHPVTVIYQGNEMTLFPITDEDNEQSQTYLLAHQSVAGESVRALLQQCRLVLAGSISEADELEITVTELGLTIDESAAESLETNLEQIIEIYLHLSHNDGIENPAPLCIELCVKYRSSHRLEYLLNAVAEDKGLSALEFPYDSESINDEAGSYQGEDIKDRQNGNEGRPVVFEAKAKEDSNGKSSKSDDRFLGNSPSDPRIETLMEAGGYESNGKGTGEIAADKSVALEDGKGKEIDEAAEEDDSIIDYSEEEYVNEESSAGSSTLQGETLDPNFPAIKAPVPGLDTVTTVISNHQGQGASDAAEVGAGRQSIPETVGHADKDHFPDAYDGSHVENQDGAGFVEGLLYDSEDLAPEKDLRGSDLFEDEKVYDEPGNQIHVEGLKSSKNESGETTSRLDRDCGNTHQPTTNVSSYDATSSSDDIVTSKLENKSTKTGVLVKAVNGAEVLSEKSNLVGGPRRVIDNTVTANGEDLADKPNPSTNDLSSLHSGFDDDEITYDDDIEEPLASEQQLPPSPRSLKRVRSSFEREADASSSDIKRPRAS